MNTTPPQTPHFPEVTVLLGDPRFADQTKHDGAFGDEDIVAREKMMAAFRSFDGFSVAFWDDHATLLDRLRDDPPAFVMNFCDTGYRNNPYLELHITATMDLYGVPYSGATPATMAITYDKALVRAAAQEIGVTVPGELFLQRNLAGVALPAAYPALIKPSLGDGSQGITQNAKVDDEKAARAYLDMLRETLPDRPVLIQEYLPGPEYGVGVIGNPEDSLRVLPILEVDFSKLPPGLPPILSFESKTDPNSPYWTDIGFKPAKLPDADRKEMEDSAKRLFERFKIRDYGRFDFRRGADGRVKLMEVNANPAWGYDGKLAIMSGLAGMDYPDMLRLLLDTAQVRIARERGLT
jgi:D-alanine-D-alanine ligase